MVPVGCAVALGVVVAVCSVVLGLELVVFSLLAWMALLYAIMMFSGRVLIFRELRVFVFVVARQGLLVFVVVRQGEVVCVVVRLGGWEKLLFVFVIGRSCYSQFRS